MTKALLPPPPFPLSSALFSPSLSSHCFLIFLQLDNFFLFLQPSYFCPLFPLHFLTSSLYSGGLLPLHLITLFMFHLTPRYFHYSWKFSTCNSYKENDIFTAILINKEQIRYPYSLHRTWTILALPSDISHKYILAPAP